MVLIVQPDTALQNPYSGCLQAAGHDVAVASGAQQAIAALENKTPRIIVSELQLHAHSGVEFLHELRSYSEWQHIPVILNTFVAKNDLAVFDKAFEYLGVVGHIYKPQASLKSLVGMVGQNMLAVS